MGCDCEKDKAAELLENPGIRKSECKICPMYKRNSIVGPTCGDLARPKYDEKGKMIACGCILKLKWIIKSAHCPQGKW